MKPFPLSGGKWIVQQPHPARLWLVPGSLGGFEQRTSLWASISPSENCWLCGSLPCHMTLGRLLNFCALRGHCGVAFLLTEERA